jgi:hypothetical protein
MIAGWRGECAPAQQQRWDASGRAEAGNNSRPTSQNKIAGTIAGRRGLKVAGYADRCACVHAHSHCRASNQFVQNTSVGNVCLAGGELHVFSVGVQAAPMHLSPTNHLHDSSERRWQPSKGHSTVCGVFPSLTQLHRATVNCIHTATSGSEQAVACNAGTCSPTGHGHRQLDVVGEASV